MTKAPKAFDKLQVATNALIASTNLEAQVLWQMQYEHRSAKTRSSTVNLDNVIVFPDSV